MSEMFVKLLEKLDISESIKLARIFEKAGEIDIRNTKIDFGHYGEVTIPEYLLISLSRNCSAYYLDIMESDLKSLVEFSGGELKIHSKIYSKLIAQSRYYSHEKYTDLVFSETFWELLPNEFLADNLDGIFSSVTSHVHGLNSQNYSDEKKSELKERVSFKLINMGFNLSKIHGFGRNILSVNEAKYYLEQTGGLSETVKHEVGHSDVESPLWKYLLNNHRSSSSLKSFLVEWSSENCKEDLEKDRLRNYFIGLTHGSSTVADCLKRLKSRDDWVDVKDEDGVPAIFYSSVRKSGIVTSLEKVKKAKNTLIHETKDGINILSAMFSRRIDVADIPTLSRMINSGEVGIVNKKGVGVATIALQHSIKDKRLVVDKPYISGVDSNLKELIKYAVDVGDALNGPNSIHDEIAEYFNHCFLKGIKASDTEIKALGSIANVTNNVIVSPKLRGVMIIIEMITTNSPIKLQEKIDSGPFEFNPEVLRASIKKESGNELAFVIEDKLRENEVLRKFLDAPIVRAGLEEAFKGDLEEVNLKKTYSQSGRF